MTIKFYSEPPVPIPEVEGIIESIDRDTYETLVNLVVEDHGCLFPQTLKYSYTLDYIPTYRDLIQILINRKESSDAIMRYEENLYFSSAEDQNHIFRSLYMAGCDEGYLTYLMSHCDISPWDISMKLIEYWEDSKLVEERIPEFITSKMKDKRVKSIEDKVIDMKYADAWYNRDKSHTKAEILEELNQAYKRKMTARQFESVIQKYRNVTKV